MLPGNHRNRQAAGRHDPGRMNTDTPIHEANEVTQPQNGRQIPRPSKQGKRAGPLSPNSLTRNMGPPYRHERFGGTLPVLTLEDPPFGPVVAAQPVALGCALLIRSGPGDDDHAGDVGVLVLDGGPCVFEGGDDAASVLLDGPGFGHDRVSFVVSVCTLMGVTGSVPRRTPAP